MAPERVTSIDAGPAADLYALGIILFEMLVGTPPFDADSIPGFFIKHMRDAPPRPSTLAPQCPRRLEELILALLEKSPDARPVDAHQVIKELSALAPVQGARSVPPPPMVAAARPAAAPTLLPTTLELWGKRTAVFDEMMQRAYPNGGAPAALVNGLAQIRSALATIQQLRSDGLKAQRQLEALEGEVRVGRARLGNAVQTLGEDLSNARNAARQAVVEVEPYFEADRQAQGAYEKAHAALETLGGYAQLPEPRADLARALRSTVDSLDRWVLSHGAAQKAHRWVDSKQGEVGDLEFQIKALRQQLERLEGQYEQDRQSNEQTLKERGQAAEALEKQLLQMASDFCEPLRPRGELRALFAQLERAAG
jgi:serine/threonine-protein kinase